jgi:outer membrane protein TolC
MKKKLLGVVLALAMMMSCASAIFAADATDAADAADTENPDAEAETETEAIVPDMNFTGEPISLSLEDALERITSVGPGYESAVLAKESLEAQAKGQEELWSQFRRISNELSGNSSMTINPMHTLNARIVKIARPYFEEQAAIGYEIDLNTLVYDTTRVYHSVLQAQEALAIAEENRRIQNEILANTQKMFELGMTSKMDVLLAESAVQAAAVEVNAASGGSLGLIPAKMSFNIQLDLPVMQTVVLTDTLHKVDAPEIDLKTSIVKALSNRNELKQLQFDLETKNLEIADLATASRYGSEYLTAALELKTAEKRLKDAKAGIELEIRAKYLSLQNLSDEIASFEKTVANAKEGYRLADLSYNAGMSTLVDVQNAQFASYQAQLGLAAKTLEYNLAVSDFEIATGYGKGTAR